MCVKALAGGKAKKDPGWRHDPGGSGGCRLCDRVMVVVSSSHGEKSSVVYPFFQACRV